MITIEHDTELLGCQISKEEFMLLDKDEIWDAITNNNNGTERSILYRELKCNGGKLAIVDKDWEYGVIEHDIDGTLSVKVKP